MSPDVPGQRPLGSYMTVGTADSVCTSARRRPAADAVMGLMGVAPPPRALILGSGKTVHRYRKALESAYGVRTRSVEVLHFQVDDAAAQRAVDELAAAPLPSTAAASTTTLSSSSRPALFRVIATSSVAVQALSERLERRTFAGSVGAPRIELLVVGPATERACRACPALSNVTFCGTRLRDVYDHLESIIIENDDDGRGDRSPRTVLIGAASGGDRSYRERDSLRGVIEHWPIYDSCVAPDVPASITQALRWLGPRGCVVVTSSKTAEVLARVVAADEQQRLLLASQRGGGGGGGDERGGGLGGARVIAQGPTTAATSCAAVRRLLHPPHTVETAAAPSVDAIAELILRGRPIGGKMLAGHPASAALFPVELRREQQPSCSRELSTCVPQLHKVATN